MLDEPISIKEPILKGYLSLMFACAGLFEPSRLGLVKFMFDANNFICKLSWSISSHFVATHT